MSINQLPREAQSIAQEMGWKESTVILHLDGFIAENDLADDLAKYAREAAEEESIEVDETASFEDVVEEASWDEDSQIIHMVAIITEKGLEAELFEYFSLVAEEERDDEDEEGMEEI